MNAGQFCPGRSMLRRRMILALPVCLLLLLLQIFPARAASPRQAAQAEKSAVESAVETTNDFREIIKRAKDKVFPAVVFIRCMSENMEEGKKTTQSSSGSGVIISAGGEVLTNWHVIDKAIEIRCLLSDGTPADAKVVGSDKDTDLAVLQLKVLGDAAASSRALPCAVLGSSAELQEGDFVMAMGAPYGLSRSVSMGIISCTRRFLSGASEYSLWLQTDASISPGNSGGPLVNTAGEVIGLNARGTNRGGEIGFAIPAETIKLVLPQLRESAKATWSWTGLQLQPIKDFNRNMYFDGTEGVIVADTDPESPARKAGIRARDRILKINGKSISAVMEEDLPAARRELAMLPRNAPATLDLLRDEKMLAVTLTPREKGAVEGDQLDCPRWDFTAKTINQFDNPDLFFQRQVGVFVFGVKQTGNAASAGLQGQDILVKIDGKEVKTLEDVKTIHQASLAKVQTQPRVVFTVLRNGLMKQVVLDISRDYLKD